jgi:predicted PhzF superfamily epimerase YddE/YHI9
LAANKRLPDKQWFVVSQGIEVHHPSRIEVPVAVERGRPTQVRVAGEVVPVMKGALEL